jgi:hypothetical protein
MSRHSERAVHDHPGRFLPQVQHGDAAGWLATAYILWEMTEPGEVGAADVEQSALPGSTRT